MHRKRRVPVCHRVQAIPHAQRAIPGSRRRHCHRRHQPPRRKLSLHLKRQAARRGDGATVHAHQDQRQLHGTRRPMALRHGTVRQTRQHGVHHSHCHSHSARARRHLRHTHLSEGKGLRRTQEGVPDHRRRSTADVRNTSHGLRHEQTLDTERHRRHAAT